MSLAACRACYRGEVLIALLKDSSSSLYSVVCAQLSCARCVGPYLVRHAIKQLWREGTRWFVV